MDRFRGRYIVTPTGGVVPEFPEPYVDEHIDPLRFRSQDTPLQGPTQVAELLLVDIRQAKMIPPGSQLYEICQGLSEHGACGVIASTLVIDLLEACTVDRKFLLDRKNWPLVVLE
jgi:hypothetical protein